MDRCRWALAIVLCAGSVVGCGGGAKPAAETAGNTDKSASGASAPLAKQASDQAKVADAPPDATVRAFLESVQTGDDAKAASMLTELARQKTKELDLVVAPQGSKTAKFEIGDVEIVGDGGAHVGSKWTDIGSDGKPQTDEIVWMLRHEPEGWRIAGMATKFLDSELPLLLNFEDPEDMLRKQHMAEQEMAKREAGGGPSLDSAQLPAGGVQSK